MYMYSKSRTNLHMHVQGHFARQFKSCRDPRKASCIIVILELEYKLRKDLSFPKQSCVESLFIPEPTARSAVRGY